MAESAAKAESASPVEKVKADGEIIDDMSDTGVTAENAPPANPTTPQAGKNEEGDANSR
jgi:hypothetical protein